MAETPLTDSIEALTTYANQVTGASDTNLSDAVYTLVQGYGGGSVEILKLPDGNLTNSSNIDTYFGNLVSGWDTEIILLFKIGNLPGVSNELIATWSKYARDNMFSQVYRCSGTSAQSITRNDWTIKTVQGTKYYVCRFGTLT